MRRLILVCIMFPITSYKQKRDALLILWFEIKTKDLLVIYSVCCCYSATPFVFNFSTNPTDLALQFVKCLDRHVHADYSGPHRLCKPFMLTKKSRHGPV